MSCCVRSRAADGRGDDMIEMRRARLELGDGLIAEEVDDLREDWMQHADQVLADEEIVAAVMLITVSLANCLLSTPVRH